MLNPANFDEVYANKPKNVEQIPCKPPACFVGSYAPVSRAGKEGPFHNNTYLLQSDRKNEIAGPVPVRSGDLKKCKK